MNITKRDDVADSEAKGISRAESDAVAATLTPFDALSLICDTASQEWQEPNGERRGAIDTFGERQWFITDAVMREARAAVLKAQTFRKRIASPKAGDSAPLVSDDGGLDAGDEAEVK